MIYLASYDAHKVRDYTRVYELLSKLGAVRLLLSSWPVRGSFSAEQLRDAVRQAMDGDDSVAVIEVAPGAQWATVNVQPPANQVLAAN